MLKTLSSEHLEVVRAAAVEAVAVRCMHRVSDKSRSPRPGIDEETEAGKAVAKIRAGAYEVVGGTAWVWPREELAESIDVLFVDEAGQMSLANVLACAQAARNCLKPFSATLPASAGRLFLSSGEGGLDGIEGATTRAPSREDRACPKKSVRGPAVSGPAGRTPGASVCPLTRLLSCQIPLL